ncbi:hypothetical protein SAMN06265361_10944 [Laceyella tengchongensis]|uniref:Uncharacterized protein n=1 Tax=Laceyella tengchongensis TaxID=574699 RepID=A0AA45WRY0_9BACL|nr:hypothetical protein SAMN06265361_10944 [Laceyella tengchongensis]
MKNHFQVYRFNVGLLQATEIPLLLSFYLFLLI